MSRCGDARHCPRRDVARAAALHRVRHRFRSYGLDAIAVDATDYLLKPVSRAKLAATLDRVRSRLASQLVHRDIADATTVQSHMWPGSAAHSRLRHRGSIVAARGVGGDFYDLFPIGRGGSSDPPARWALLLGDASGKGLPRALSPQRSRRASTPPPVSPISIPKS
jgi:hypothetical protein